MIAMNGERIGEASGETTGDKGGLLRARENKSCPPVRVKPMTLGLIKMKLVVHERVGVNLDLVDR